MAIGDDSPARGNGPARRPISADTPGAANSNTPAPAHNMLRLCMTLTPIASNPSEIRGERRADRLVVVAPVVVVVGLGAEPGGADELRAPLRHHAVVLAGQARHAGERGEAEVLAVELRPVVVPQPPPRYPVEALGERRAPARAVQPVAVVVGHVGGAAVARRRVVLADEADHPAGEPRAGERAGEVGRLAAALRRGDGVDPAGGIDHRL